MTPERLAALDWDRQARVINGLAAFGTFALGAWWSQFGSKRDAAARAELANGFTR